MAIDLGNFGQLVANQPQLQAYKSNTLSGTFSAIQGYADQELQKQQDAQRLRARAAVEGYKQSLADTLTSVDNDLKDGQINVEDIHPEFESRANDVKADYIDEAPEFLKNEFQASLDSTLNAAKYDVEKYKDQKITEENRANFLTVEEQIKHRAATDPDGGIQELKDWYKQAGGIAGFTADELKQRQLQQFSNIRQGGLSFAIQSTTDVNALKSLKSNISQYQELDAAQMATLTNQVDAQVSSITNQKKSDDYYQIANLSNGADYYADAMANGAKMSDEDFNNFSSILSDLETLNKSNAGKTKEFALQGKIDKLKAASETYKSVLDVNGLPLNEQKKSVFDAWKEANSQTDIKEKLRLSNIAEAKQKAFQDNINLAQTDPYKIYERQSGKPVEPIDFTNPDTYTQLDDAIKNRLDISETTKMMTGVEVGLFKKAEADQLKSAIDTMTPQRQVKLYESLYKITGKDKFDATINQLKQNDESAAVIANLSVLGTPESKHAAVEIANGKKIADEKTVKMSSGSLGIDKFNTTFDEATAGFFASNSKAANVAKEATMNAYLSLSDKAGQTNPDFDQDRFETAFKTAVGGSVEFNGKQVIPPYGMNNDTFNNSAVMAMKATFASNPNLLSKVDDMELVMPGSGYPEGAYAVVYGGSRIYYDKEQTKPVIIQVK